MNALNPNMIIDEDRSLSRPSLIPGMRGQSLEGEIEARAPEFLQGLAFPGVALAWTAVDLVGHQLFDATAGANTPPYYYRNKIIFGTITLAAGKILSDAVGGSRLVQALTLTTAANALLQLRYLYSRSEEFNLIVFLIHQVVLFPLSFLLVGQAPLF